MIWWICGSVRKNGRQIGSEEGAQLDGGGERGPYEFKSFFDDGLKVQDVAPLFSRTAESEDSADEVDGARTGFSDLVEALLYWMVGGKIGDGEFNVSVMARRMLLKS